MAATLRNPCVLEDPKNQNLDYRWCDVGVLDYDEEKKLYLVQKTDKKGLVRDETGMPIVNGGVTPKGTSSMPFPGRSQLELGPACDYSPTPPAQF